MHPHTANSLLMVSPTGFMFNEENAATNHFQHHVAKSFGEIRDEAKAEFDAAVAKLRQAGVTVLVHVDSSQPPKPDAVFPNNWFTTWPDGSVYTYPMAAPNRRLERDTGVLDDIRQAYTVTQISDLSAAETRGVFLEATGAIVFDHVNRVAYGCVSQRCDPELFRQHVAELGYEPVLFAAFGSDGAPIYHTNILLAIQTHTAIVCLKDIADPSDRAAVRAALERSGRQIVELTHEQLIAMCGNVLEVRGKDDQSYLVLSQQAYEAFTPEQRAVLSSDKQLLPIGVPIIEKVGGGGIRCMMAEIFLPAR